MGMTEQVATRLPEVRRFYLPGVLLRYVCPKCGMNGSIDVGDIYMNYPTACGSYGLECVNWDDDLQEEIGCGHMWDVAYTMELKVTFEGDGVIDDEG